MPDDSWRMTLLTRFAFVITALLIEIYAIVLRAGSLIARTSNRVIRIFYRRTFGRFQFINSFLSRIKDRFHELEAMKQSRYSADELGQARNYAGDVPGWVLVVLMTTGLVTALWTIAAPRLSTILRTSLDAMNGIR